MRIFITGFMGAGKTYLGRTLAEQLGFQFLDLDELVETELEKPISAIFEESGEAAFRQLEAKLLRSLANRSKIVVATGGGCPCFFENMDWMNSHGITVYFFAPVSHLAERLLPERDHRPLITSIKADELEAFIEGKLWERAPFYEQSHLRFAVPRRGTAGLEELGEYLKRFFT